MIPSIRRNTRCWIRRVSAGLAVLVLALLWPVLPASAMYGETEPSEGGQVEEDPLFVETAEILGVVVYRDAWDGIGDLDQPSAYTIQSDEDPIYQAALQPVEVGRWSRAWAWDLTWTGNHRMVHYLYLELPHPLVAGASYTVSFEATSHVLDYQGDLHTARAIKANQVGYLPDGPKMAYLGDWIGTLGALHFGDPAPSFFVVEAATGTVVYSGTAERRDGESPDEHGEELYTLDFTELQTPGQYVVSVAGVGASYPFRIGEDVYAEVARTVARALYHQRCGQALQPEHTDWTHGECHRQQTVTASDCEYFYTRQEGSGDMFGCLADQEIPGEVLPVWGGYHDAGDYDRRPEHVFVSLRLLELYEAQPTKFHDDTWNIPESGNGIPDIVDEARWGIDFFARMQDPSDGGVRAGIETSSHPDIGVAPDGDTENSIPLWAYAKGECISLPFAVGAARLVRIYDGLGRSEDAEDLLDRAIAAYEWALGRYDTMLSTCWYNHYTFPKADLLAWAAMELYLTTEDSAYHDTFLDHFLLANEADVEWGTSGDKRFLEMPCLTYVLSSEPARDATVLERCQDLLRQGGDKRTGWTDRRGYRVGREPWLGIIWGGGSGGSFHDSQMRAHVALGEQSYRDYAVFVADYWLGSNPLGLSLITGIGHRSVQNPLHIPSMTDGIKQVVPGIPIFGPVGWDDADPWQKELLGTFTPAPWSTPPLHSFADVRIFATSAEFTADTFLAACAQLMLYLAPEEIPPPPPDDPPGDGGAGGAGGGTAVGGDPSLAPGAAEDSSGCSCRAGQGASASWPLWHIALLLAILGRRTSRRRG